MRTLALALVMVIAAKADAQRAEDAYFGDRQLEPNPEESDVLEALETNRPRGAPSSKPVITADKSVRFVFGASHRGQRTSCWTRAARASGLSAAARRRSTVPRNRARR